ncbi:MAG: glutamate--cysteine ligase [Pseudomonadota bacterium]
MSTDFRDTLRRLTDQVDTAALANGLKGLEKESLRATPEGGLAGTPHPAGLGSALTNDFITTDFSEALLEFVTPARSDFALTHRFLADLHRFAYQHVGSELLWPNSMPCRVGSDAEIPLANYGSSNVGTMKTVYRRGLGERYGRIMQTIAGLHFNYSIDSSLWAPLAAIDETADVDTARSSRYLGLLRNHRRYGWLLLYLFGASPAMCKSFIGASGRALPEFDADTVFEPYATSLRMSDLGYSNKTQARLAISLDTLDDYVSGLCRAISTPEPSYEKLGVKVDGRYRQLNANVLQIENEYYSPMRPKRVARSGERPTLALGRGGIEYVELRSVDLNPFDPVGITPSDARFIELFLLYCLLEHSPMLDDEALARAQKNQTLTATYGRDPGLLLYRDDGQILMTDWGLLLTDRLAVLAEVLDGQTGSDFSAAVAAQRCKLDSAEQTPSARLIEAMATSGQNFIDFNLALAETHRDRLGEQPLAPETAQAFAAEALASAERQAAIEAADTISFDDYLAQYFADPC